MLVDKHKIKQYDYTTWFDDTKERWFEQQNQWCDWGDINNKNKK